MDSTKDKTVDFVVVGGGIAGIYVAWRLATAPIEVLRRLVPNSERPTVCLYERTGRVGGRLLTVKVPGTPFRAELGGMRFASSQLLVTNLVNELAIPSSPFEFDTCLMYLRGYHLTPQRPLPYKLRPEERRRSPAELVKYALKCALREVHFEREDKEQREIRERLHTLNAENEELRISILSPKQWGLLKQQAILHNARLYEIGFWNLLAYYLSSEAFLFAHDGLGYESILANWNAAEAIPWFLKDFGVDYLTLGLGMGMLPIVLEFKFLKESPNSWHTEREWHPRHQLTSVQPISNGQERLLELSFNEDGKPTKPVRARYAILALPKQPLKELNTSALPGLSQRDWHNLLDSVMPHPLFKLFLAYERAWWKDPRALGRASGRVSTDLPIRQVYYFSNEEAHSSRGMLMASYSDAHYVDFWNPLLISPGRRFYYRGVPLKEGGEEEKTLRLYGAIDRMVGKAHSQILQLHPELPADSIPKPYVALVMNWSRPPYDYGGWHTWNVNTLPSEHRPWEVRKKLAHPFDANVYVCGEAYSCEQGWVEGALRSAEMVLHSLKIPTANWIDLADYKSQGFEGYEEYIECEAPQTNRKGPHIGDPKN